MCNRFRSIHEWSEIPRRLQIRTRLNFDFNPNVAPTELVPVFLATREGDPEAVIARFRINLTGKDGKPRSPLLNARTAASMWQSVRLWRRDGDRRRPRGH